MFWGKATLFAWVCSVLICNHYYKFILYSCTSDPKFTTSVSEKLWGLECRDEYVKEATEYPVLKERVSDYVENVFSQIWNIWGHKYQKHRLQFVNSKDWLTAKLFLRDPKAIQNMMNNVNHQWFHVSRNNEYLNERWQGLWEDIKFYIYMSKRMIKAYNDYHYPDGWLKTRINDFLGIKNELREEALKHRTTVVTTTKPVRVYDKYFFNNYYLKNLADKKK